MPFEARKGRKGERKMRDLPPSSLSQRHTVKSEWYASRQRVREYGNGREEESTVEWERLTRFASMRVKEIEGE